MPTEIITDQPIEHIYTAVADQDEFDFTFQIFNGTDDLYIEVDDVEVGAYTVTYNTTEPAEGGYITLDEPCAGGETVIVRRVLAMSRVTQFPNTGPVSMPTVNHELNRVVGLVQQVNHTVNEAIEELAYSDEQALDVVATALAEGNGITIVYDDANAILTITCDIDAEYIRDTIFAALTGGVGIEILQDDSANTITIQSTGGGGGGGLTTEDVRDIIGQVITAGAGIDVTVDDGADTVTIANASGAYTAENARDDVGAALVGGTGIEITLNDVTDQITIAQDLTKTLAFFVPAVAMKPRATNGPAPGSTETTTNDINFDTLDYDSSTSEAAQFVFRMPKSVDESGSFKASFGWFSTAASGTVRWGVKVLVLADDGTLDTAVGGGAEISDATNGATKLNITAETAGFTISGLAAENLVVFQVYRLPAHADDNLAADAKLLWMDLKVPMAGFDDA